MKEGRDAGINLSKQNHKKKLLVADYDHTLYVTPEQLQQNIQQIKQFQEQGNFFAIATSRNWKSMQKEINQYQIPFDYLCTNLGASIFNAKEKEITTNFIPSQTKDLIETILREEKNIIITRFGSKKDQEEQSNQVVGYKIKGNLDELLKIQEKMKKNLPHYEVIIKEKQKLFINNPENSKEKAIQQLIDTLGINQQEIITIGDDDVDLAMLEKYNGYRMEQSSYHVTKKIKKTVSSVAQLVQLLIRETSTL